MSTEEVKPPEQDANKSPGMSTKQSLWIQMQYWAPNPQYSGASKGETWKSSWLSTIAGREPYVQYLLISHIRLSVLVAGNPEPSQSWLQNLQSRSVESPHSYKTSHMKALSIFIKWSQTQEEPRTNLEEPSCRSLITECYLSDDSISSVSV